MYEQEHLHDQVLQRFDTESGDDLDDDTIWAIELHQQSSDEAFVWKQYGLRSENIILDFIEFVGLVTINRPCLL